MIESVKIMAAGFLLTCFFSQPAAADPAQDPASLAQRLEQEFKGGYSETLKPTGRVQTVELVADEAQWGIVPPYQTAVWAYNGTVPGPVLRVKLGDTLKIRLTNRLEQATTVH